jgi:segregation and condensation protein A
MGDYSIRLPDFEGPLDLLLQLIERRELDITRVSLAAVADQYLEFISRPGAVELNALADYLVIAARLILIKSRLLLSHPEGEAEADGEDSAEALACQLRQYRQFKQVAQLLRQREHQGLQSFPRRAPLPRPIVSRQSKIEGLSFDVLYDALRRTIVTNAPLPTGTLVEPLRISIHHRIQMLRELTLHTPRVPFSFLLHDAVSRLEVIVIFLAVLESIKRRLIKAQQDELFGEIYLVRRDDTDVVTTAVDEVDEIEFTGA